MRHQSNMFAHLAKRRVVPKPAAITKVHNGRFTAPVLCPPCESLFDIVINVGPNDAGIIMQQLQYTKKNICGYRNIYLVAPSGVFSMLHDSGCILIDEAMFPVQLNMIHTVIGVNNTARNGWYLQQLLKLYAGLVIPNILERWLVIDADTFFLRPTTFVADGKCLYAHGIENNQPYFTHMTKLLPLLHKYDSRSGICHHMIFEKRYVTELFGQVEALHNQPFWEAFLTCVSPSDYAGSGASEYEIYFNYMQITHPNDIIVRQLLWENVTTLNLNAPFDYISYHHYSRK